MSRMPRLVSPEATWLSGLRACLRRIRDQSHVLLVAPGTAGSDFVVRGAQRLGLPAEIRADCVTEGDPANRDRAVIESADELLVLGVRKQGNIQRLLTERLQAGHRGVTLIESAD